MPLVAVVTFSLVVLEYWNPPVHLSELSTPAILKDIRDEPGDFTVLHAPLGRRDGWFSAGDPNGGWLANHYQWMHEKPTIGGYMNRSNNLGWIMEQPGLAFLSCPHCSDLPSQDGSDPDVMRSLFREYRIRYVVLHRLGPRGQGLFYIGESELTAMDAYLRDVVGLALIYEDSTLAVYRNEEVGHDGT